MVNNGKLSENSLVLQITLSTNKLNCAVLDVVELRLRITITTIQ